MQDLVSEANSFMWALVDHNPRVLDMLSRCNVETATQLPFGDSRDWPSILASFSEVYACTNKGCQ